MGSCGLLLGWAGRDIGESRNILKVNRKSYWKTTLVAGLGFFLFAGMTVLCIVIQPGATAGSGFSAQAFARLVLWGAAILCSASSLVALLVVAGGLVSLYYDAKGLSG